MRTNEIHELIFIIDFVFKCCPEANTMPDGL